MKLLIIFIVCNILNVIIQTVKSICTIKCGKMLASIINAVAYGFYTYIVILTVCDLPIIQKCIIVALCNLVGVFVVKWIEEKARKDKLWKIEATVTSNKTAKLHEYLTKAKIPHNYIAQVGKWTIFNCYAETQKESEKAKRILNCAKAKYFVSESKTL